MDEKKEQPRKENIHAGHRERLRNQFINGGINGFSEINALELLLFYAVPRRDTNVLAHRLLDRFGSLNRVFSASYGELLCIDGVGPYVAVLLRLVPELARLSAVKDVTEKVTVFKSTDQLGKYGISRYRFECDEVMIMLCFDGRNQLISEVVVNRGSASSVSGNFRLMLTEAIHCGAHSVVIMHNHVGAEAYPSKADITSTAYLYKLLKAVDIEMRDHIIVSGDNYYSMFSNEIMYRQII